MKKYYKDGKVAVLYSPGYGAGWSTWNSGTVAHGLLFDSEIVQALLSGDRLGAIAIASVKYPDACLLGGDKLTVGWLPEGTRFEIDEYDGSESIRELSPADGWVA